MPYTETTWNFYFTHFEETILSRTKNTLATVTLDFIQVPISLIHYGAYDMTLRAGEAR
jgi:hypothetical protein